MVAIRPIDQIVAKWQNRASAAAPDYESGVRSPLSDWATNAAAAEANYTQGVQQAIAQKRFSSGVKKAGTSKWQEKSIAKGTARFSQGISVSVNDYNQGFAQVHSTIARLSLPARGAKGDPRNLERVRVIADALRKLKTGTTTAAAT
ncbi:MAG: hypothetical protein QXW26_04695 [Candidatus Nitrosocaldus sp.]